LDTEFPKFNVHFKATSRADKAKRHWTDHRLRQIESLRSDEHGSTIQTGKAGIEQVAMEFYRKLFSVRTSFVETGAKTPLDTIPPGRLLEIEEIGTLRDSLTEQKLLKDLKACGSGSAPGMDGLLLQ
jgi:hypothetical protein